MSYISGDEYKIGIDNGIQKATIYRRVYQYGWDIQRAITEPAIPREARSRKHPKKYTDMALQNGICLVTFYSRLKKGWTYEEAATKPLRGGQNFKKV